MWTIFKELIELSTILFFFFLMFWFFDHRHMSGILALQPGTEPPPSTLEDEDLTTGLPEKSRQTFKLRKYPVFFSTLCYMYLSVTYLDLHTNPLQS